MNCEPDNLNSYKADFINQKSEKKKVFYYEGFYGSLVADVEGNRLLGKIEGITNTVIYEGRTVRECEQQFREAVSRYKKRLRTSADRID